MPKQTELLRKIDFFQPLNQKIIDRIAQACIEREYSKGEYIVKQDESGLGLFFITRGRVKVEIENNGTRTLVTTLQSDDFLGELSLIDNKPRSADVICLEDTSCFLLTHDSFTTLMNKYPEIAIQMAKTLAGRVRAGNEKMVQTPPPSKDAATPAAGLRTGAEGAHAAAQARHLPPASNKVEDSDPLAKNKVKDFLVDTFGFFYTIKALTRFSAAVIGCPVEIHTVHPVTKVAQAVVDGVKIALFPAEEDGLIRIEAYNDGDFSAAVFQPAGPTSAVRISRFEGRVGREDRMYLHVPNDRLAWLERPE